MSQEITALGVPSILVPLPNSPGNHQEKNALFFEKNGSAILLPDNELSYISLSSKISYLLEDESILLEMGKRTRGVAHLTAGDDIVDLISSIIERESYGK